MKKRILLAVSILLVFGLAIAAFAYQQSTSTVTKAACCCCSGDSCPMKKKDSARVGETASCCDKDNCCCKNGGESCPMKGKDHTAMHQEISSGEAKGCCPCCADGKDA